MILEDLLGVATLRTADCQLIRVNYPSNVSLAVSLAQHHHRSETAQAQFECAYPHAAVLPHSFHIAASSSSADTSS